MKETIARISPARAVRAAGFAAATAGFAAATAVLALAAAVLAGCGEGRAAEPAGRPDVVVIDGMSVFGDLERPPVRFAHDRHTQALAKQGESCSTCHLVGADGVMTPKFMRTGDADREAVMDVYHEHCIACHKLTAAAGDATGPVTCGECHRREPLVVSNAAALMLDHSLHQRHVVAADENCEPCHHEVEGKQHRSSCRDCHLAETEGDRRSLQLVFHKDCLGCHVEKETAAAATGPTECGGCHDRVRQLAFERIADPPRLDAGQPAVAFMQPAAADLDRSAAGDFGGSTAAGFGGGRMGIVRFDHAGHEGCTSTCRACHHESLKPCSECHTVQGAAAGRGVTLADAMHDPASPHSCMGCHNDKKGASQCAGCHGLMAETRMPAGLCGRCHSDVKPSSGSTEDLAERVPPPARTGVGKGFSLGDADIPATIQIAELAGEYEPARFPHRLIIDSLRDSARTSRIAAHFHAGDDTICAGCHHHSPAGQAPPRCGSCHGKPFDENNLSMPGLTAAYHQQCIGCHQEMELHDLTGCTACHERKPELVAQEAFHRKQED